MIDPAIQAIRDQAKSHEGVDSWFEQSDRNLWIESIRGEGTLGLDHAIHVAACALAGTASATFDLLDWVTLKHKHKMGMVSVPAANLKRLMQELAVARCVDRFAGADEVAPEAPVKVLLAACVAAYMARK